MVAGHSAIKLTTHLSFQLVLAEAEDEEDLGVHWQYPANSEDTTTNEAMEKTRKVAKRKWAASDTHVAVIAEGSAAEIEREENQTNLDMGHVSLRLTTKVTSNACQHCDVSN